MKEILSLLRQYHEGHLHAYLSSLARTEQGVEPSFFDDETKQIAESLLALPADRHVVEETVRTIGLSRARTILRSVLAGWSVPRYFQLDLLPYFQRTRDDASWLMERISVGVTGIQIQVVIWRSWPRDAYEALLTSPGPAVVLEYMRPWWDGFDDCQAVRIVDDVGTHYEQMNPSFECHLPIMVMDAGTEDVRVAQRYELTLLKGPPSEARALMLSGTLTLTVELPVPGEFPWKTRKLPFGDFSYSIELPRGWDADEDEDLFHRV